ncbi:MAG TPA: carboxypeptidase regulatory-like domain-containing protein, partial [Blastocatellia bacterium]
MKKLWLFLAFAVPLSTAFAQTTQGIITGRVYDQKTGRAIKGASIACQNLETGLMANAVSAEDGYYTVMRLTPGSYSMRVTGPATPEYQPREAYELELFVAGLIRVDVPLRQSADTYSQSLYAGTYLPNSDYIVRTYLADLAAQVSQPLTVVSGLSGTLVSTLSYVVDPQQVRDLPLSGRDIYTMVVMLPGVTADNATARGLGYSSNGQRSYSSNFLLDGVENNDTLLSGPQTTIAPEATEEYRISTNNFSAEYGGAAGLVANATTRAGSNSWHGVAYSYLNDTSLNANNYQNVAQSLPRQPQTDIRVGFWTGSRIIRDRLFWSSAVEGFRSRGSTNPEAFQVPALSCFTPAIAGPIAISLLSRYPPPVPLGMGAPNCSQSLSVIYNSTIPLQFNSVLGLGRLDYISPSQRYRLLSRLAVSRYDQPDFIPSIYPGFSSNLGIDSTSATLAHLWSPRANVNNELRFGYRNESQGWDRPNPDVPQLQVLSGFYSLPGSPTSAGFHYGVTNGDLSDLLTLAFGRQVLSIGGGVLVSRSNNQLTY